MAKAFSIIVVLTLGVALSGCTYCDWPLYVPQGCKAPPAPAKQ